MTKGFLIVALQGEKDYLRMAYALALSIKQTQRIKSNVCLITNISIDSKVSNAFDHVINVDSEITRFSTKIRSEIFNLTPFDETILLDSDMLILNDISDIWEHCQDRELIFCDSVLDYRGNIVKDSMYKKDVARNNLLPIYSALQYFKKTELTNRFYNLIKIINNDWKEFYDIFLKDHNIKDPSNDVTSSIAIEILNIKNEVIIKNKIFSFIHMKPNIQQWKIEHESWMDVLAIYFRSLDDFKIGNFRQQGIFHYVESDFLIDNILNILEKHK